MKESTRTLILYKLHINYIFETESFSFFHLEDPYIHGPSSVKMIYFKSEDEYCLVGSNKRYTENELVRVLNLLVFAQQ